MPLSVSSLIACAFFDKCSSPIRNTFGALQLDIVVRNDLNAIAPWTLKIEKRTGQWFNIRVGQRLADCLLVIDHKSKRAPVVRRLLGPFWSARNWPPNQ